MLPGVLPKSGSKACELKLMTDVDRDLGPSPMGERFVVALRQVALLTVALIVAGLVTERLQPEGAVDRGIASTAFLWAILVWAVVLLVNAVAFDTSQISALEGRPLYCGLAAGAILFIFGLIGYEGGTFGSRVVYLFANAMGAVMFWWGLCGLGELAVRRLRGTSS